MKIYKRLEPQDLSHHHAFELLDWMSTNSFDDVDTVVLSMKEIELVDVSGFAVLVRMYTNLRHSGRYLVLTDLTPEVRDVFIRTGVAHMFLEPERKPLKETSTALGTLQVHSIIKLERSK